MESIFKVLLIIHIVAGATALLVAPVAMLVKKGKQAHRNWGKAFFWSMTFVFITAIVLSVYRWNPFLLMIAVFSYYSVVSGYRWIYLKKLNEGNRPALVDWFSLIITLVFNTTFVGFGLIHVLNGGGTFAYLAMGFGLGGLLTCKGNLIKFLKPHNPKTWLYEHIGGMLGGYIATLTAFSAQVIIFLPGWLQWTWPSILGIPLITYWINQYKRKDKVPVINS